MSEFLEHAALTVLAALFVFGLPLAFTAACIALAYVCTRDDDCE